MSAGLPTESVHGPEKQRDNLRALLAIAGYELYELADSTYLVSRWNLTRVLPDLHAVHQFAKQAGAA
jgi:hypothetical protein